ncbi:hypothetical protein NC651_012390 [Populus alba x Populus x berolinensis]|nr:hypothetical protein NC651_012390 [Populus alba x Populus x berolinensis]
MDCDLSLYSLSRILSSFSPIPCIKFSQMMLSFRHVDHHQDLSLQKAREPYHIVACGGHLN